MTLGAEPEAAPPAGLCTSGVRSPSIRCSWAGGNGQSSPSLGQEGWGTHLQGTKCLEMLRGLSSRCSLPGHQALSYVLFFSVITALIKSAAWPLFAPAILAFSPHAVSELPGTWRGEQLYKSSGSLAHLVRIMRSSKESRQILNKRPSDEPIEKYWRAQKW